MRRAAALLAASLSLALPVGAGAAPLPTSTSHRLTAALLPTSAHSPAAPLVPTSTLHTPASIGVPPSGFTHDSLQVLAIAARVPKIVSERAERHNETTSQAFYKAGRSWQVSYYDMHGHEFAQVIVDDRSARVTAVWTGFQVAWTMARGYPGAFGRKSNAVYVWLPASLLFFLAFFDWRNRRRLLHLDLLMLLAPSISFAFFNHANIGLSVPLAYPTLIYFLIRMLLIARARGRPRFAAAAPAPLHISFSPWWLAVGLVFLIGFRIGLNVTDANVIDVGYAGVIGAERLTTGQTLYANFPSDNQHGDTYGPVNYEAYVPMQALLGWSGRWDDLPAAHLAAVVFDLLAIAGLYLLGLRIRGPTMALVLAYAWAACPWTLLVLESNANDTLVGIFVIGALLACSSPPGRGAMVALAGWTKFAPLALAPLFASFRGGLRGGVVEASPVGPRRRRERIVRWASFAAAFALTTVIVFLPVARSGVHTIYERTLGFQNQRGSPFSVWGLYGGIGWLQAIVQGGAAALALVVALLPRRRDVISLAALAAAVLIATQLGVTHWFYLYMVWWLPALLVAIFASYGEPLVPESAARAEDLQVSARPEPVAAAAR